jgi:tRNA U34 5-carboxymethylaminomethyl modifying enzyme MnmG/GidA
VQEKDTRKNSSMGQGVRSQRKSATRLAYKACFKGSVEINMELKLRQRHRYENVISKTQ